MMLIRRVGGPTVTETGEYCVWLTDQLSEACRRRLLKLAQAKEAKALRISLEKNAVTLAFPHPPAAAHNGPRWCRCGARPGRIVTSPRPSITSFANTGGVAGATTGATSRSESGSLGGTPSHHGPRLHRAESMELTRTY
jgi:hypothetical protein